jgi:hypothetical protein
VAPNKQGNTYFSMERGMRTMNWVNKRIISADKRAEFVTDRILYIIIK